MHVRQLGTFRVTARLIREDPDYVAKIFALLKLVPVRLKVAFANTCIAYTGISDKFRKLKHGERIQNTR